MNSDAPADSTTEAQSNAVENTDTAENADTAAPGEGQLQFEEKRWREVLGNQRAVMGDAEETCVFLIDDLLAAIFEEMRVRSENAALFSLSAQQICTQAFEGVNVSAFQASDSLDRIPGPTQHQLCRRQQVLKPQSKWTQCPLSRTRALSLVQRPPPLLFLRRLLNFLELRAGRANIELQRFPSSEAISALSGKRRLIGIGSTGGFSGDTHGEWCISIDHTPVFLQELLSKGLVSAVPSTVAFVLDSNRDSLEKMMHSQMRVTLPHLRQFVLKALLAAEEEEEESDDQRTLSRQPSRSSIEESKPKTENESTPRSRIFQTEVPLGKVSFQEVLKGVKESTNQRGVDPQEGLLSSYLEEVPPRAIEMDCRAPGQVCKKAALGAANSSKRAISRKVLLLLAPPPRQGSRWTTVRHKVIVPSADAAKSKGGLAITAEADMEIHLADVRHPPSILSTLAERKTDGAATIAEIESTPDAAALSNIFSLGTPRQLSGQELARRNDLLAQLEREAAHAQRRATTTVIASMSLVDSGDRRENDGQFEAYVAANSTITTGVESDGPTRPQQIGQSSAPRNRGRGNAQRSKFDLERDALPFSVSGGNTHVREELSVAMCSPIKRTRASVVPSPPPETPGRPIRTASTLARLPQLDSSRLAVGVSAVVRGVEKYGPRRNPSRKTWLQLHNCSTAFVGVDGHEAEVNGGGQMPFSPVRTSAPAPSFAAPASRGAPATSGVDESYRLPMIPAVSPIKASPHRKHVVFKVQNDAESERAPASISPKSHVRQRPSAMTKQPVWEAKTRSPPRTRNHHFASGRNFRKIQRYDDDEEEASSSARRQKQEEQDSNIFRQPMAAPRRHVLPTASEFDED